jgi:hypothetical protein
MFLNTILIKPSLPKLCLFIIKQILENRNHLPVQTKFTNYDLCLPIDVQTYTVLYGVLPEDDMFVSY